MFRVIIILNEIFISKKNDDDCIKQFVGSLGSISDAPEDDIIAIVIISIIKDAKNSEKKKFCENSLCNQQQTGSSRRKKNKTEHKVACYRMDGCDVK